MRSFARFVSSAVGIRPGQLLCAVALLLFAASSRSEACSCMPPGPPADEFPKADAVFVGKVTRIEPNSGNDPAGMGDLKVTLHLEKGYRGDLKENVEVVTAGSSAACGYGFAEGDTYVVYANSSEEKLHVSLCSRTAAIGNASEDLKFFETLPKQPTQPSLSGSSVLDIGKNVIRLGISGGLSILGRDS